MGEAGAPIGYWIFGSPNGFSNGLLPTSEKNSFGHEMGTD